MTDESDERREAAKTRAPAVIGGLLGLALAAVFHVVLRVLGITMSPRSETGVRLVLVGLIGPIMIHALIMVRPEWLDKGSGE